MEPKQKLVVLPGWWFELLVVGAAGLVMAHLASGPARLPSWPALAVFVPLMLLAGNSEVVLPSKGNVSPVFMIVMAALSAFGGRGTVLGACLVGMCSGVSLAVARRGRLTAMLFNCGQYLLASAAAASVYLRLGGGARPAAFVGAVAAFILVNGCLVLPQLALNYRLRAHQVWAEMWPTLPNYVAFGLLGLVIGQLYRSLGPVTLPLIVMPGAIARKTFGAFLELRGAHEATVRVFVRAIEAKDPYTAGHSERVAKYSLYMGEEFGFTPGRQEHLRSAALMHDIGKLAVPTRLLNKPGRLTPEEYEVVRRHNEVCIDILTRVDFMKTMVAAASDQHARYEEGRDRASGLVLEAYVITVADAFDAMTSTRSYRRALSQDVAFAELRDKAGTQFHPECVEALIRAIERRGETYGLGYEEDSHEFRVAPPVVGVGSAGLGDVDRQTPAETQARPA